MADRHFVNGGVNLNWGTIGNWSATEGGAGGAGVPLATDNVFFDAGSPNCTINTQTRVALTLTTSAYTGTLTFTYGINVSGSITIGASTNFAGSTASKLSMIATGTWTTNGLTIPQDLAITTAASITATLAGDLTTSGDLYLGCSTGTTFAGNYHVTAATCTITASQTVTLVHDVTITGLTTIAQVTVIDGAFNWNTAGITMTADVTGTATIVLTGGTWSGAGAISNKLTFAGSSIVSGTVYFAQSGTPTLTYSSGTITTTDSTLSVGSACTFNTNGISWNNLIFTTTTAMTITINSLLTVLGTMTLLNANITFDGTSGWTVGTLTNTLNTATRVVTLKEAVTYTITTAWTAVPNATKTFRLTWSSAHVSTKAILTLAYGAAQKVWQVDPNHIDSSLGQAIYTVDGTIHETYNWTNTLSNGNVTANAGGESVTVAGITKDNAGVALGSCDVYLFRDNGNDTATYIAYVESNAITGAYSFTVFPGSAYFVVAFKGGATPVMDVTYRDLAAV